MRILICCFLMLMTGSAIAGDLYEARVEIRGPGGNCLDVRGPSRQEGAAVQVWGCMNVSQQRWNIYSNREIRSEYSGMCLTADERWDGTDLVMRSCNGSFGQKWFTANMGKISSTNRRGKKLTHWGYTGRCIDIENGSRNWGTPAQIYSCTSVDAQSFVIVPTKGGSFDNRWRKATRSESLCFSVSSCARFEELKRKRTNLIASNGKWANGEYVLNHHQLGNVLWGISWFQASTTEKVWLWNSISQQGQDANFNYKHRVSSWGAHPLVKNKDINGYENTRAHTAVPFWDGYHGSKVDYTLQDAFNMIWEKENSRTSMAACYPTPYGCPNYGDISSSTRSVMAMQEFQRANDFYNFAYYWNYLIRDLGNNLCPNPIYLNGCSRLRIARLR